MKVDLDASAAGNWSSVAISRPETPFSDSFDGLFVQPETEAGDHSHICSAAGLVDLDGEYDRALKLGFARFLRKFGLDFMNQLGRYCIGKQRVCVKAGRTVTWANPVATATIADASVSALAE